MGYKPTKKRYNLVFEDYPGLEVSLSGLTIQEVEHMQLLEEEMKHLKQGSPEAAEKQHEMFSFIAQHTIAWNFEHPEVPGGRECPACGLAEDAPMPISVASIKCIELDIIMAIQINWVMACARVSLPKGMNSSNGGGTTPELNTQAIEQLLENLQSPGQLPTLNSFLA